MSLLLIGASVTLMAQPEIEVKDLSKHGLTLLGPQSPEFAVEMDKLVPAVDLGRIQRVLPYSVFVKNSSGKPVIALLVRYEIVSRQSGLPAPNMVSAYSSPAAKRALLAPGSIRFVCPVGFVGGMVNRKAVGSAPVGSIERELVARMPEYEAQRSIAISLDSAVFQDGTLVGPDRSKLAERLAGDVRAEEEFKLEVLKREGRFLDEYLAHVSQMSKAGKLIADMTEQDHYRDRLTELAKGLLTEKPLLTEAEIKSRVTALPIHPRIQRRIE